MNDPPLRLEALDVFRGLTIAAMILVSTPGTWNAVYAPLLHADWNGWTPTDLVFPFLLFAMGAAVPFALARRRGTRPVARHVLRRAAILFALGLALNAIETTPPIDPATFRLLGVLQRIALVFAAVAWLTETTSRRTQMTIAIGSLLAYWAALALVPLAPGDSLPGLIDRTLLGQHVLAPWGDPEGFLSTIPSIATALAGVFAGDWLMQPRHPLRTLQLWAAGAAATVLGLAWGIAFPINKNLWTSSFAVFSAGMAAQTLALCHWLTDALGWRTWSSPFAALGRNALAAYFLSVGLDALLSRWTLDSGLSLKQTIYRAGFAPWLTPCCGAEAASLAYAVAYVALWAVVMMEMRRRRMFVAI